MDLSKKTNRIIERIVHSILHGDNAPSHTVFIVTEFQIKNATNTIKQPQTLKHTK